MDWLEYGKIAAAGALVILSVGIILFGATAMRILTSVTPVSDLPRVGFRSFMRHARTGDVILTQPRIGIGVPMWDRAPLHVGVVWVHPRFGPCVAEVINPERSAPKEGALGRGFRVVTLDHYVGNPNRIVLWRALHGVSDWARKRLETGFAETADRDYSPVLASADTGAVAILGFGLVWPEIPLFYTHFRDLAKGNSTFCSRWIMDYYLHAGILDTEKMARNRLYRDTAVPSFFLSTIGPVDRSLADGVGMGKETVVVYETNADS
jgi:hypothetical protein